MRARLLALAGLFVVLLSTVVCAQSVSPMPRAWQSKLALDHILAGRIFKVNAANALDEISEQELVNALDPAGIVLLGEVHDNPDHHVLQAWITRAITSLREEQGSVRRYPALVFEQLRSDQQEAVDQFLRQPRASNPLAAFKDAVSWSKSGWQDYNYDPLFQVALIELAIIAADVPRQAMKEVAKKGADALDKDVKAALGLDAALGDKADAASLDELFESHCEQMPRSALTGMAFAQRYRDASLADATIKAARNHGSAILIAGNGHARKDRGVPWYIRQRDPGASVVSLLLLEVEPGKTDPTVYVPLDPDGRLAADYVILTPAATHEDHCAAMKK